MPTINILDQTDKKILKLLQEDSSQTIKQIAQKLHLTTTPVYERIKKLERSGIIDKYVALVDPTKLGLKLYAFIDISIKNHSKEALEDFVSQVIKHPEVMECHHVSGESDFFLKILTVDIEHYNDFVLNRLSTVPNLAKVVSRFSLSNRKQSHVISF